MLMLIKMIPHLLMLQLMKAAQVSSNHMMMKMQLSKNLLRLMPFKMLIMKTEMMLILSYQKMIQLMTSQVEMLKVMMDQLMLLKMLPQLMMFQLMLMIPLKMIQL